MRQALSGRGVRVVVQGRLATPSLPYQHRGLCKVATGGQDKNADTESEDTVDPKWPTTAVELFEENEDESKGFKHKKAMQGGAGGLAVAGLGLLAYQHQDVWCNLDFAGGSMVLAGARHPSRPSIVNYLPSP